MPESSEAVIHISSAVVRCRPVDMDSLSNGINAIEGAEVVHGEGGKLVVILEGPSSGAVGEILARISLMDGVVSATMVYEQVEPAQSLGEEA